jgi:hypothetical protein
MNMPIDKSARGENHTQVLRLPERVFRLSAFATENRRFGRHQSFASVLSIRGNAIKNPGSLCFVSAFIHPSLTTMMPASPMVLPCYAAALATAPVTIVSDTSL